MKKFLLIIPVIILTGIGKLNAQSNPRYVLLPIAVCPIDNNSLNTKEGLKDSANKALGIVPKPAKSTVLSSDLKRGTETVKAGSTIIDSTSDTLFVMKKIVDRPLAFNVIETIGTFSKIKFWELSKKYKGEVPLQNLTGNPGFVLPREFDYHSANTTSHHLNKDSSEDVNDYKGTYLVKSDDIKNNTVEFINKNGQWNIGFTVLPVKLRTFATQSGKFDFSSGFSLGPTLSWTTHYNWAKDYSFSLLAYPGVSSVPVSKETLNNKDTATKNIAAFSPAVGVMFEKHGIQLNFMVGMDFPAGQTQKTWVYRNMPWFGLGVGFSIFKIQTSDGSKTGQNSK